MYSAPRSRAVLRGSMCYGLLFFCICFVFVEQTNAQSKIPCNQITGEMGYTVKSVEIAARWIPPDVRTRVEELVGLGRLFDPPNLTAAMELLREELVASENMFSIRLAGSTSVLYLDAEVCDISDSTHTNQARVTIRAHYLRIDLYNIGRNFLPVPRTGRPAFFRRVPKFLLLTSPVIGITTDRQYGAAVMLQTSTDLLQIPEVKTKDKHSPLRLNADLDLRKSLEHPFYSAAFNLNLVKPVYTDTTVGWSVDLRYAKHDLPLGKNRYRRELLRFTAAIQGSSNVPVFRRFSFGIGGRYLENNVSFYLGDQFDNPERALEVCALTDGRIGQGLTRIGLWFDAGSPNEIDTSPKVSSYQRFSGRIGYGFVLGKGHTNFDMETSLGAGFSWGSPPVYHRYFAGNATGNFLHVPFTSRQAIATPEGPVVRSLGERESGPTTSMGGNLGGTSFINLNMSVAVPIARWSRPLIPDVVISEEPRRLTLRSALKGQASTARNVILDDLILNRGFPEDEKTEEVAEKIVNKDIRPALNYLADRANIYSVKPLMFFDIARINDRELPGKTWLAIGAGLQLMIVVAKLDIGYMHTLSPSADKGKGNLVIRFTVQNFY